jgi:glutamine synthetase
MYGGGVDEKATRLEFRCPDPTANPYLAFPAMLVSGIEGIKSETDPTKEGFGPFDEDIWEKEDVKQTPRTLFDTLEALKKDEILVKSGVFTKEILESYVEVKMDEIKEASLYPTPADFHFYGDI